MPGFKATAVVDAPIEEVFRVVADPQTHPEWSDDELSVQQISDGKWRTHAVMKGRPFSAELTETVRDAPSVFEFRVVDESGTWRQRFDLVPEGGACRVTRSVIPEVLDGGQRLVYMAARFPLGKPALRRSLARLAERFA
jgi:uncharacterized protein YndB with AHSA1/START domain